MNHLFRKYCEKNSIIHIHPFSHGKAVFIERLNQTIQKLLHSHLLEVGSKNFMSVLSDVVHTYNTRPHRMLGNKSPQWAENNPTSSYLASINKKYLDSFLKYQKKPKFKVGDRVRIKKQKNLFDKNYDANFSDEYYTVIDIIKYFPVNMYSLESLDRNGEDKKLIGYFYEYQIQKVDQDEHRISSIIQRKNGKSLVRWKGFDKKFDSWEPDENIKNLNGEPYR